MIVFSLHSDDLWILLTAAASSVACGVLGCFLVLRKMSLLGDAISHAVLPGVALAFLITGTREAPGMLAGALVTGVLTAFLSHGLTKWGKVPEDAAMGVVFTSFFAIGVLLINWVARDVDLDPGCTLYGLLEFTPFDTVALGAIEVPRALVRLGVTLVVNIALVSIFFKELKIVSFDPALATTMGINATAVHYGLMTAVAATTVASIEAVGSILVVSMLIAPGATAYLLTDRLPTMLALSAVVSVVAAFVGYFFAVIWNTSVAGMMSVTVGMEFLLALLFAPRYGYVSRRLHQAFLSLRICREDILGFVYRWSEVGRERNAPPLTPCALLEATAAGPLEKIALWDLRRRGKLVIDRKGELALTPLGQAEAQRVVRSHRLWESYLAKHLGLPLDHLHAPSARVEHFITPTMAAELANELGEQTDPHGRQIPR